MSGFGFDDPDMADIMENIEGVQRETPKMKDHKNLDKAINARFIDIEEQRLQIFHPDTDIFKEFRLEKKVSAADRETLEESFEDDTGEVIPEIKDKQNAIIKSYVMKNGQLERIVHEFLDTLTFDAPLEDITPTRRRRAMQRRQQRDEPDMSEVENRPGGGVDRRFGSYQYRAGGYNLYGGMQTPTDRPVPDNRLRRDDLPVSRTQGTISSLQRGDDCGYLAFYHFIINRGLFELIQDKKEFLKIGRTDVCKDSAPTPTQMLTEYIPNWSSRFQLMAVGPTKDLTRKVDPTTRSWRSGMMSHNFESLEQLKLRAKGKPGLVYALFADGPHLMALINDINGTLRLIDSNNAQLGVIDEIAPFDKLFLYQLDGPEFDSAKARKQKVELKYIMQGDQQIVQAMRDWEVENAQDAADVVYLIDIMRDNISGAKFPPFVEKIAFFIDRVNGDNKMQTIYNGFLDLNNLLKAGDPEMQERLIGLKEEFLDRLETMFKEESEKVSERVIQDVVQNLKEDFEREPKRPRLSTGEEEGGPSAP